MDHHIAENLINNFFENKLTREEQIEFEKLLQNNENIRSAFQQRCFLERSLTIIANQKDKEDSITRNIQSQGDPITVKKSISLKKCLKYAAIFLIPILVSLFILNTVKMKSETKYLTYKNEGNTPMHIILPDSSRVILFTQSTIVSPCVFKGKGRSVELLGKATFDVVSDMNNQFVVKTHRGEQIKAYGTKFNIVSYDKENEIEVFLERGKVDFLSPEMKSPVIMKPNDLLIFNKNNHKYTMTMSDAAIYDASANDILMFKSTPLIRIVKELSRKYNVEIEIGNQMLKEYLITASFKDKTLIQILDMLKQTSPGLDWREKNGKFTLYKDKNLRL